MTTLFNVTLLCVLFFISNVIWAWATWYITSVWSDICNDMVDTCLEILDRIIKDEKKRYKELCQKYEDLDQQEEWEAQDSDEQI